MGEEDSQVEPKEEIVDENLPTSGQDSAGDYLAGLNSKNDVFVPNRNIENGIHHEGQGDDARDQLIEMVFELSFQNAYLKEQFDGIKDQVSGPPEILKPNKFDQEEDTSQLATELQEKVTVLSRENQELKETQKAAVDAMEHLRIAYSEADAKAHELSTKLVEAQKKMEQEIKERDEKYVELDTKFTRLHKRAKQRIQDVQKEKDDLEARFREATEMASRASSQQLSQQQELERTRQQANDALRSMDTERQQLRAINNKLRDNIDEMHRTLETKDNALEELRQSLFEKEQMLDDTQRTLQAAEDRKQNLISELSNKHQKAVESLEAQITELTIERSKAAETISSLQAVQELQSIGLQDTKTEILVESMTLLAEKDSKIAELESASTGEAVRLGAAIEATKAEIAYMKKEHEKEKESWETACQALTAKLEASESANLRSELEAAKLRSVLEQELSLQIQLASTKDSELVAAKNEIKRLESEFSSYKVRAHALLQKKDADLLAAKSSEAIKAQEEALKEAEREVVLALAERDMALQELQNATNNHDKEMIEKDAALSGADQQVRSLARKLDSAKAQYLSEKELWQKNLDDLEEKWRLRYTALEAQKNESSGSDLQSQLDGIRLQYIKLKEEHDTFRDIADRTLEEKEKEILKLVDDNKSLRQSLETRSSVNNKEGSNTSNQKQGNPNLSVAALEQQILLLARQQAQREEELAQSQRHILALQDEIEELERENRLHTQQEAMLKEEVRNVERKQKREGVDMTYLKNVILKLLETGEVEALLPVVGTLLQFSPVEIRKCQQASRAVNEAPRSPAAPPAEPTPSTPPSLFSRFSFS